MTDLQPTLQLARWFALVCLLLYCVMLTVKARQEKRKHDAFLLTARAYKDLLRDSNAENAYLRGAKCALEQRLRDPQRFNYDLTVAPAGTLQLLTRGGARLVEPLGSLKRAQDMGIVAWASVAQRDKGEEIRLGLVPPL